MKYKVYFAYRILVVNTVKRNKNIFSTEKYIRKKHRVSIDRDLYYIVAASQEDALEKFNERYKVITRIGDENVIGYINENWLSNGFRLDKENLECKQEVEIHKKTNYTLDFLMKNLTFSDLMILFKQELQNDFGELNSDRKGNFIF